MCSDYTHRSNHDLEAVKKPMKIGDWTCRLGESALLAATFSLHKLPVSISRHQLIPLLPFGIWRFQYQDRWNLLRLETRDAKKKYEEIRVFAPENQSKSISVEHQRNQMLGTYFPKAHHKAVNQIEFSSLFNKEITSTNQPPSETRGTFFHTKRRTKLKIQTTQRASHEYITVYYLNYVPA